jgi:ketosteroid isomerase-like protein
MSDGGVQTPGHARVIGLEHWLPDPVRPSSTDSIAIWTATQSVAPSSIGHIGLHCDRRFKTPTGERSGGHPTGGAMAHDNLKVLQDGYAAFGAGDIGRLSELFTDDVTWHVPGNNALSGDYHGKQEVFGFFGKLAELTNGTFHLEVHDLLADDTHGIGLAKVTGTRGDRTLEVNDVNVFHLLDGKVTECWLATTDQQAEDAFWA